MTTHRRARRLRVAPALVIAGAVGFAAWANPGAVASTAENRTGNAKLPADRAAVLADEQKIAALAAHQVTEEDLVDLLGLEQDCLADVGMYNAEARGAGGFPAAVCNAPTAAPARDRPRRIIPPTLNVDLGVIATP
jgi:hypothetical protein